VSADNNTPVIESSVFDSNRYAGIQVISPSINFNTLSGNSGSGNAFDGTFVAGAVSVSSSVSDSASWPIVVGIPGCSEGGAPMCAADLDVPSGVTLTAPAGSVVKFGSGTGLVGDPGSGLTVEGTLVTTGTSGSPAVFTSWRDSSTGTSLAGVGGPQSGDWSGITIASTNDSDRIGNSVFEYADVAIHIGLLDALSVQDSVFSYNDAAFEVDGTADNDPLLGALDCVPPYLSVVDATTDWFGSSGYPTPSIDLLSVLGAVIPAGFSNLFGSISTELSAEGSLPGDNTVPWAIYSCPELDIPPIPVTAVVVGAPVYPLTNSTYKEQN
jgi:hypothetical protein